MKYFFLVPLCLLFSVGHGQNVLGKISDCEHTACLIGAMKAATNQRGEDEPLPTTKLSQRGFFILVDTNDKTNNFVSVLESGVRHDQYTERDSALMGLIVADWKTLSKKEKLEKMAELSRRNILRADSIHEANQGKIQVRLINNSTDTIAMQMQDWAYICVLQALTKNNEWMPVQYWNFSKCGNSYHHKYILPKSATSFVVDVPNSGNQKTKLRFKILGKSEFYYSNEFSGKINDCEFVENRSKYPGTTFKSEPSYKLDTMRTVVYGLF